MSSGHKDSSIMTRLTDGIIIHSKLGVTATDTELFCFVRKYSDSIDNVGVSTTAKCRTSDTVRRADTK